MKTSTGSWELLVFPSMNCHEEGRNEDAELRAATN